MLLLIKVNLISKKKNCKKNYIKLGSFSSGKVVFIQLIKIITLHIRPIIINVRRFSFEFIPKWSFFWLSLSLDNELNDLV